LWMADTESPLELQVKTLRRCGMIIAERQRTFEFRSVRLKEERTK